MNYEKLLMYLKTDVGITSTAYDVRLKKYLKSSAQEIEREHITLDPEREDDQDLVVSLAAWKWRHRETGEGIPRMIRREMNNRIFDIEVE